jgi:anti-sigma factor RsiW
MIAHLSTEQLSECILGQPSPLVSRHVQQCTVCREELANFQEALGSFRGAVRTWSQEEAHRALAVPAQGPQARSLMASRQLAWALLIAAVFVIASFVVPARNGKSEAQSDAVLLNQVDTQVSRTAPSSMEPLMKLVGQRP